MNPLLTRVEKGHRSMGTTWPCVFQMRSRLGRPPQAAAALPAAVPHHQQCFQSSPCPRCRGVAWNPKQRPPAGRPIRDRPTRDRKRGAPPGRRPPAKRHALSPLTIVRPSSQSTLKIQCVQNRSANSDLNRQPWQSVRMGPRSLPPIPNCNTHRAPASGGARKVHT